MEQAIDDLFAAFHERVAQLRDKPAMIGWFVGQTMHALLGRGDPKAIHDAIADRLAREAVEGREPDNGSPDAINPLCCNGLTYRQCGDVPLRHCDGERPAEQFGHASPEEEAAALDVANQLPCDCEPRSD